MLTRLSMSTVGGSVSRAVVVGVGFVVVAAAGDGVDTGQ